MNNFVPETINFNLIIFHLTKMIYDNVFFISGVEQFLKQKLVINVERCIRKK